HFDAPGGCHSPSSPLSVAGAPRRHRPYPSRPPRPGRALFRAIRYNSHPPPVATPQGASGLRRSTLRPRRRAPTRDPSPMGPRGLATPPIPPLLSRANRKARETNVILTLTPNPSLDLLFEAESLRWNDANRLEAPRRRPGGQGINVVRAARALGGDARAV